VYGSKDPDPYQNVTDPEHCFRGSDGQNKSLRNRRQRFKSTRCASVIMYSILVFHIILDPATLNLAKKHPCLRSAMDLMPIQTFTFFLITYSIFTYSHLEVLLKIYKRLGLEVRWIWLLMTCMVSFRPIERTGTLF
jgi:hypothetical protein